MSYRRMDEHGNYREYDPQEGKFIDDYPIASNIGQIEHQTVATLQGNNIDPDEIISDIVDETGVAVLNEDQAMLTQFIKTAISVDNLVETFNDNAHETLIKLLALQDNKHPLKKGGVNIAYRTDALIMHCKMEFSAPENIVFDAILGTMSSLPENKVYRIEPTSFLKYSNFENENYLYETFRKGTDKLTERHLKFENLGPDGEDDIIVPWFDILRYHKKSKKNEVAYIEFKPSDFFKDLALCSQIVHGAYGSLEVTTQLRGKYTHALYWYLENKKKYKEYPSATPGMFNIAIDEFKNQFSIPEKYKKSDIERRVLGPAAESINNVNECDFTFEYKAMEVNGKLAGYSFIIKEKRYITVSDTDVIDAEAYEVDPFEEQIKTLMSLTGYTFSDSEIHQIYQMANKYNREAPFIMQAASVLKTRLDNKQMDKIESPFAYVLTMIKNGTLADPSKIEGDYKKVKNQFHNFSQRDYNIDELEKVLMGY